MLGLRSGTPVEERVPIFIVGGQARVQHAQLLHRVLRYLVASHEHLQRAEGLPLVSHVVDQTVEVSQEIVGCKALSAEHGLFGSIQLDLPNFIDFKERFDIVGIDRTTNEQGDVVSIVAQVYF